MLGRRSVVAALGLTTLAVAAGCSADGVGGSPNGGYATLRISAIPDQDPDVLTEREEALAAHLAETLGIDVEYVPVPDYAASVALFGAGDLDLVFYGGLTGVQARLQNPQSAVIAQRDIDEVFTSIFIAGVETGIEPVDAVEGLTAFAGTRFTFGSETSTSGRLMPSYFLGQAGVTEDDFDGEPGYSGSHDTTLELVSSGSYQGGALNSQVWDRAVEDGAVDPERVVKVLESPEYHDYHWLLRGDADDRFGTDLTQQLTDAMLSLHQAEAGPAILEQYGCERLIASEAANYDEIEEVARGLGLIG
ncbi:putative selenate ABC transporter substrate-binding protein [Brachybacterium sp. UNK5269]|uniref:putative selenate ABC transporter substrate-binding protein n=1 Tax=Brachybacterium sp. UNK5269 TaxID=3408576 RepID=UPI003BB037E8